jgi:hypothetical protein
MRQFFKLGKRDSIWDSSRLFFVYITQSGCLLSAGRRRCWAFSTNICSWPSRGIWMGDFPSPWLKSNQSLWKVFLGCQNCIYPGKDPLTLTNDILVTHSHCLKLFMACLWSLARMSYVSLSCSSPMLLSRLIFFVFENTLSHPRVSHCQELL